MAVSWNRVGATLTLTVTENVADLAGGTLTKQQKIDEALRRCSAQIGLLIESNGATIDAEISRLQAVKAALPAVPANF